VLHQAPSHEEVWGREGSGADSKHQHHMEVTGQLLGPRNSPAQWALDLVWISWWKGCKDNYLPMPTTQPIIPLLHWLNY